MQFGDAAGLLGDFSTQDSSSTNEAPITASQNKKRKVLRRGDYAATQIFQPHGPCAIEKASLQGLWNVISKGNKYLEFYDYIAESSAVRRGVAISQFAQCMKHAMNNFREDRVKIVLRPEIYHRVKEVVDDIYPKLEVLDGGNLYKPNGGFNSLDYSGAAAKDEQQVEQASKYIYAWLNKKDDAFRAYLSILSGSGALFAAQVEEKILRSYVVVGSNGEESFVDAAKKRLCTEQGYRAGQEARDDLALTQAMDA